MILYLGKFISFLLILGLVLLFILAYAVLVGFEDIEEMELNHSISLEYNNENIFTGNPFMNEQNTRRSSYFVYEISFENPQRKDSKSKDDELVNVTSPFSYKEVSELDFVVEECLLENNKKYEDIHIPFDSSAVNLIEIKDEECFESYKHNKNIFSDEMSNSEILYDSQDIEVKPMKDYINTSDPYAGTLGEFKDARKEDNVEIKECFYNNLQVKENEVDKNRVLKDSKSLIKNKGFILNNYKDFSLNELEICRSMVKLGEESIYTMFKKTKPLTIFNPIKSNEQSYNSDLVKQTELYFKLFNNLLFEATPLEKNFVLNNIISYIFFIVHEEIRCFFSKEDVKSYIENNEDMFLLDYYEINIFLEKFSSNFNLFNKGNSSNSTDHPIKERTLVTKGSFLNSIPLNINWYEMDNHCKDNVLCRMFKRVIKQNSKYRRIDPSGIKSLIMPMKILDEIFKSYLDIFLK